MPWDGNELWTADFKNGKAENPKLVAGGPSESIFEPQWSPDNELYFVSDRTGWWNLYHLNSKGEAENIYPMEAEFGYPQWIFGVSTLGIFKWQYFKQLLSKRCLSSHHLES